MYQPRLVSRTETLNLRNLRHHVRHWGPDDAPVVFFLHGWMDASATFQFVVDALAQPWHVIAPDWRGYGNSQWLREPYWFPDYYADLEALLRHYSPDQPVRLVGHSMGANIAATYAAARGERVSQVVMLDFLGLTPDPAIDAAAQLRHWLDAMDRPHALRAYPDHAALAARLLATNPRLTPDKAAFLAHHVGQIRADGKVELAADPWHKVASPTLYRVDEVMSIWRNIRTPLLMLNADDGFVHDRFGDHSAEYERRLACFATARVETIAPSSHNLQHDQPEAVALALERFLSRN